MRSSMFDLERQAATPSLQTIRCSWPVPVDVDIDRPEVRSITDCFEERAIRKGKQESDRSFSPTGSFCIDLPCRRQRTAQLTMFYSGTVNVYDDIPADKAHAIMLLASGGKSWSSHIVSASSTPVPSPVDAKTAILSLTAATTAPATRDEAGVSIKNLQSSSPAPSPALSAGMKQRLVQHSHAELPWARKASLARFFEKRRERIQTNAIATPATVIEKEEIVSASEHAASSKKICTRALSQSPPKIRMPNIVAN